MAELEIRPGEKCPASTDPVYLSVNIILLIVGAAGMYWLTENVWINLLLPSAYLIICILFFFKIFSKINCKYCVYNKPATQSIEEYKNKMKEKFQRSYKRSILLWAFLGAVWPILVMTFSLIVLGNTIVFYFLLTFILLALFGFIPILLKRVCPKCKVRQIGVCPFFKSSNHF